MHQSGVESTGEPLIWEHADQVRVLIVGRSFQAITRAAAKLDLPLSRWNGIVSDAAPAAWPAIYARVDVISTPSETSEGGADG